MECDIKARQQLQFPFWRKFCTLLLFQIGMKSELVCKMMWFCAKEAFGECSVLLFQECYTVTQQYNIYYYEYAITSNAAASLEQICVNCNGG